MRRSRATRTLAFLASVAMLAGAATACESGGEVADVTPVGSDDGAEGTMDDVAATSEASEDAPVEISEAEYTKDDIGTGWVTYDGVRDGGYRGDCDIDRQNGSEDVGDLATPGLTVLVGVSNESAEAPSRLGNYKIIIDPTAFNTTDEDGAANGEQPTRGSISSIAYGSEFSPKSQSSVIALVIFTGETEDGVPVVAELVCGIQNKF